MSHVSVKICAMCLTLRLRAFPPCIRESRIASSDGVIKPSSLEAEIGQISSITAEIK